jgi:hypothetical protein
MTDDKTFQECPSEDLILDYHHRELSPEESINLRTHIEQCNVCFMMLTQYESLADAFANVRKEIEPASVILPNIGKPSWTGGMLGKLIASSWKPVLASSFAVIALSTILISTFSESGGGHDSGPAASSQSQTQSGQNVPDEGGGSESLIEENDLASVPMTAIAFGEFRLANFDPDPDEGIRLADILNEVE